VFIYRAPRSLRVLVICAAVAGFATTAGAAPCTIDGAATKQSIDGFGFASVWSGRLSTAQNDILFGTSSGQLGFTLLRVRIDPNKSWADETANAAAAHAHGARVLGTPWSPPAAMKTSNNVVHGSLRSDQYAAYASYLNQAATSIGLDWVSLQNEPDWDPDYEGCTWTAQNFLTFMLNNAQAIGKPIVMPESLNFNDAMSDPSLNDATAASRISVVAGHFYGNGNYVHTNAISKGKRVWMTEYNTQGQDIATGVTIAKQVSDAMNNQFNAYFWWWVSQGSQTTIIDGTTPRKTGYSLGQFAKYVRPGMTRIGTTYNPSTNVYVTAYKNGSTVSIVAINTGTSAVSQAFTFANLSATSLGAVRTSGSENLASVSAATVSNGSFTYDLPAQSITTFSGPIGGGTTTYALSITKGGTGSGTVTSSAGGISCGSTCSASYASGTTVTLTAAAASGSTFGGWSGACTGTAATCAVSMTAARSVAATFITSGGTAYTLTVTKGGTGSGTVAGGAINCGSTCSASLASGTTVTLTATAATGSTFAGWSGPCTGTGTCIVTATTNLSVTATFNASGGGTCKAVSGGQSGNFNTTGAICFTVTGTINGWGCSNADGRSVTVNGTAMTCGQLPLPGGSPYTFSFSAGTYSWASFYWW
jgi:glucuronoarabinoxylan endo-1,4-beta-xylanase